MSEPVPFLYAATMMRGGFKRPAGVQQVWANWYEGVWRLRPIGHDRVGVVRWHCGHRHRTQETAQGCAEKAVTRRFGGNGRVKGMMS